MNDPAFADLLVKQFHEVMRAKALPHARAVH